MEKKLNNYKQIDEIDKYLDVLKNVKQKNGNTWIASCPNGFAHASGEDANPSFTISVQETKEENIGKFGKEIITYYCFAHGGTKESPGPCSQKKLTEVFRKLNPQIKGAGRTFNTLPPDFFPDDSYLEFNNIGTRNTGLYFYTNPYNFKMFLIWRLQKPSGNKEYLPLCYSNHAKEKWVERNLWEVRPLYRLYELYKTKKRKLIIVEGEAVCEAATKLFPDYFVTTCAGGAKGWHNTDFQALKTKADYQGENRFDEVILFPDFDAVGRREFTDFALNLRQRGINATLVQLPHSLPMKWDLNCTIPDDVNIYKLVESAMIPSAREENDYSNLEEDTLKNRWSHITNSRKFYWDHYKKDVVHRENFNLWYENDTNTSRSRLTPEKYVHRIGCQRVEGLAYLPTDKKVIWDDGKKYLNTYVPFQHKALTEEEIKNIDLSVIFRHLDIQCNFDKKVSKNFLDVLAHGLQRPYENLKYATLLVGDRGIGKTQLWEIVEKLYGGKKYCIWLKTRDVVGRFRGWMRDKSNLFINEIEITGYDKGGQIHILKELIDGTNHTIETKGVDSYQIKNHFRLFASSNELQQLLIEQDKKNRRWFVVECVMLRDEITKKYPNHLRELDDFKKNEHKITELAYYLKHQHKISKDWSNQHPMHTSAKENMARFTREQLYLNLDERLANRQGCFGRDMVNTRNLYEELKDLDRVLKTTEWRELTENKIVLWLKTQKAKKIKNGEAVSIDGRKKRHWWAVRNIEDWSTEEDLRILRLHMKGQGDLEFNTTEEKSNNLTELKFKSKGGGA